MNSSREKNKGMHRRRKVDEKSCVTFLLCDTGCGTSNELDVQNKWEENTHTHMYISTAAGSNASLQKQARPRFARPTLIADISPSDTYIGLPIGHAARTLDTTHPVVLLSSVEGVVRDNTVVVRMDP